MEVLDRNFQRAPGCECSIEVDPRRRRPRHAALPRRPGLQPHLVRRAGLRPGGAEGCAPHPDRGGNAARGGRGARVGLPLGERGPDLRPAEADARRLQPHARPGDRARPGPHRAVQLRAPAQGVHAAAAHRGDGHAQRRDQAADHEPRHRAPDARRLPLHRHGPLRAARRRAGDRAGAGAPAAQFPGLLHASRQRPDRPGRLGHRRDRPDLLPEPEAAGGLLAPRSTRGACRWRAASSSRPTTSCAAP